MLKLLGDLWAVDLGDRDISFALPDSDPEDVRLGNLETPICPAGLKPQPKVGPRIRGEFKTMEKVCGPGDRYCLSLANNHAMDFGVEGLESSMAACSRLGITTVGAGANERAALEPVSLDVDGVRVAVVARCERQFGSAGFERPGVAVLSSSVIEELRALKNENEIVILSVHGGAEMCPWPSPDRQATYRAYVDAGADIVHGHHSHIPQGYENYNGGFICYGLGNLLVDPEVWREVPNGMWSVVVDYDLRTKSASTVIASISEQEGRITVAAIPEQEDSGHRSYLEDCNRPLENNKDLTAIWQEVSLRLYREQFANWLGFSRQESSTREFARSVLVRLRDFVRGLGEGKMDTQTNKQLLRYHLFSCESHRDAITTALGILGGEIEDLRTDDTTTLVDAMMPWAR